MIVEKNKVVSIHYELANDSGELLESTQQQGPMAYVHGGGNILPVLEDALEGKSVRARVRTEVSPAQGYGEYQSELVQSIPLASFPNADQVKVGTQFQLDTSQGPRLATITTVDEDTFTLDMNHPLAGQTLQFDIEVADIRDATVEEIEKGHIHTEGCGCGHSHEEGSGCGTSDKGDCGCDHSQDKECGCGHSH
jgi:FKBP-type peptidyl-prolyl cis-trans isomerase SlyD